MSDGRALPAVAQCENWAVSRIFYWPITTNVGDANAVACIFAARAWLGEIDRAGKDGVAYLRGQRCPHSPQMHSPGTWKPMISKLRRYTASHRVPGNSASDDQLPVRMGVCGPLWERVSCVHREVRAAQGAACTDDQT